MPGRLLWVCSLVAGIAACRQVVGFDESAAGSDEVDSKDMPILPFVPEPELADICTRCAVDHCASEREACLGDASCRELLTCHSRCSDPACFFGCGRYASYEVTTLSAAYQIPRTAENWLFQWYSDCVSTVSCRAQCGSGLDWSCLGKRTYRWPARAEREGDAIPLRVDVVDVNGYQGIPADLAAFDSDLSVKARAETGGWGQAELSIAVLDSFDGSLQIEPRVRGYGRQVIHLGTIARPTRFATIIFIDDGQLPSPRPGFAAIAFTVTDCRIVPASGLTVELGGATGRQWYATTATQDAFRGEQTDSLGTGGFIDIQPASDSVTLLAKRDGEIMARRSIRLRADWLTLAALLPRTEDER